MKKSAVGLTLACLMGLSLPVWAQVQVGVSVGGDSFHVALGSYYHAPEEQIVLAERRHIPDEEMPVAFFIARKARVEPGVIIDLRGQGMGWGDIAARYRLSPKVFYVPIHGGVEGTPYEGFYAHYHRGGKYRMEDREIVNMVNLRFASEYYHKPADEIIRLRAGGRDFRDIHEEYHPHHGPGHDDHWDKRRDHRKEHWDKHRDHRDDHWDKHRGPRDDHEDKHRDHHDDHEDNRWNDREDSR